LKPWPAGTGAVKVYSNCRTVELFVGGRSLGVREGDLGIFVWEGVTFEDGTVDVEVVGQKDGARVSDRVRWEVRQLETAEPQ
jgi:beta-galactosidase